jgi:uncharacterized protein with FMN-binding domain
MRKAVAALVVTAVAVVLLASYDTHPPRTLNPNSALRAKAERRVAEAAPAPRPGTKSATGPLILTPFSAIQVKATLTRGKLTGVETISLTGDGPHTRALNARAEPILRAEALRSASADIDVVSGATYTSESWRESLKAAIDAARKSGRP